MHLANPLALSLLLLLLPLLLARLRRPPERRRVSYLPFWKTAAAAEAPAPSRRLRRDWLFLLQAAFLVALVVALARPFVSSAVRTIAIVVDVSMSMSASQGAASRLDAAREAALGRLGALPGSSHVHVIAADAVPAISGSFRPGDTALRQALAALAPTAAAADLAAAIERAARLDPTPDRILVFTDMPRPTGMTMGPPVEWATFDATADNAAITLVSSRRHAPDADDVQTLVEVRNYGSSPIRSDVVVTRDGTLLWRERVEIASGGRGVLSHTDALPSGVITATLELADAIALDNVRSTIVAPATRLRVHLTGHSFYLDRALSAHPGLRVLTGGNPGSTPPDAAAADVLICDGCSSVPAGSASVLLIPPRPSAASSSTGSPVPLVPTGRALSIAKAFEGAVVPIVVDRPVADADVAARAGGQPAVIAHDDGVRRIVELRFDPDVSPLSRGTGFPVLVATALDWLSMPSRTPQTITAGDALQWILPDAPSPVSMIGPDGKGAAFTFAGNRLLARPSAAGVYHVRAGGAERAFVVNPATDGESSLQAARSDAMATLPHTTDAPQMRFDATGWLAAFALLLLAAEWRYRQGKGDSPLLPH